MNESLKDQIMLHGIILVWGYTGIIGRWSTLDADQLVFIRMAAAFFVIAIVLGKKILRVPPLFAFKFLGVGMIIAAHWVSFFAAIDTSKVSLALACMASVSVFAAFLEPLFYKRAIAIEEVIASVVALGGVAMIFGFTSGYELGIALALMSSALAALFTILNAQLRIENIETWAPNGGASEMTAFEMLGGMIALFVYQIFLGKPLSSWELTTENIILALVLGVLCTALPFIGAIRVMRSVSPFTACLTINLEPVYAILLALLHFGEREKMSPGFYLAALLIIGSVMINGLIKFRKASSNLVPEGVEA